MKISHLIYFGLDHIQLHFSGRVLDGLVDELQRPHAVPGVVVVLSQQDRGPQERAGRLGRAGGWGEKGGGISETNPLISTTVMVEFFLLWLYFR